MEFLKEEYELYKKGDKEELLERIKEDSSSKMPGELLSKAIKNELYDLALVLIQEGSSFEYENEVERENDKYNQVWVESTPILCQILKIKDNQIKTTLLKEALKAGANPNVSKTYLFGNYGMNRSEGQYVDNRFDYIVYLKETTPALYLALQIKNKKVCKEIVEEMLKYGADPTAKHFAEQYKSEINGYENYEYSCLDTNNGELRNIMKKNKMDIPNVVYNKEVNNVDFPYMIIEGKYPLTDRNKNLYETAKPTVTKQNASRKDYIYVYEDTKIEPDLEESKAIDEMSIEELENMEKNMNLEIESSQEVLTKSLQDKEDLKKKIEEQHRKELIANIKLKQEKLNKLQEDISICNSEIAEMKKRVIEKDGKII